MPQIKICPICQTEFTDNTTRDGQIYCSLKCKEKNRRDRKKIKPETNIRFEQWQNVKCPYCVYPASILTFNYFGQDSLQTYQFLTNILKEVAQLFRSQDKEVIKRRTLVEFEETIHLPDGVQTFMTSKFPLFDDEGTVSAVGGVCTDITARIKTEAEFSTGITLVSYF